MKPVFKMMFIALALLTGLASCSKGDESKANAEKAAVKVVVPVLPTDPADDLAWKKYVIAKATIYIKANDRKGKLWATYLPMGADRMELTGSTQDAVARGILSGTIMVFASPDYTVIADLMVEALSIAQPKSLTGVLFILVGSPADQERVAAAVEPTGAEFVLIEAK